MSIADCLRVCGNCGGRLHPNRTCRRLSSFFDATLRDTAAVRPGSEQSFINFRGIGRRMASECGRRFINHIAEYCRANNLTIDERPGSRPIFDQFGGAIPYEIIRPVVTHLQMHANA
jgi:hypothetical protein